MQLYPTESVGIEVVPARVYVSTDTLYNLADRQKKPIKEDKELNMNESTCNNSALITCVADGSLTPEE